MGVQAAVHIDDLARHVFALVRGKIHAHMADILRAAVAGHHDVAGKNVLQGLRHTAFIFRRDDQSGSDTVAADFFLAVLECCILMWTPFSGRRAITKRDL